MTTRTTRTLTKPAALYTRAYRLVERVVFTRWKLGAQPGGMIAELAPFVRLGDPRGNYRNAIGRMARDLRRQLREGRR